MQRWSGVPILVLALLSMMPVLASDGGGGGGGGDGGGGGSPTMQGQPQSTPRSGARPLTQGSTQASPPAGGARSSADRTWTAAQWDEYYAAEVAQHAQDNSLEYYFSGTSRMRRLLERTSGDGMDAVKLRQFLGGFWATLDERLTRNKDRMLRLMNAWRVLDRWRAYPNEADPRLARSLAEQLGEDARFVEPELRRFSRR